MCVSDSPRHERGFSLIELLIVILIIGVLAAIAVPNYIESKKAAYNSTTLASLRLIFSAETCYRASHAQYGDLNALSTSGCMADPLLATGHRSNYTYAMPTVATDTFEVTASPDIAPWRYFFIDVTGVIRTNNGAPADASSPPIN